MREYLESQSVARLRAFVGRRRTLIVDEAQHVRETGLNLKLLADHVDGLRIIATGSSSFDLAQQTGEPLTGRKLTLLLLPLAQLELQDVETAHETRAHLEMRLIHGSYPEVVLMDSNEDREIYLKEPGLRAPRAWRQAYPDSSFRVVERENYLVFITAE